MYLDGMLAATVCVKAFGRGGILGMVIAMMHPRRETSRDRGLRKGGECLCCGYWSM